MPKTARITYPRSAATHSSWLASIASDRSLLLLLQLLVVLQVRRHEHIHCSPEHAGNDIGRGRQLVTDLVEQANDGARVRIGRKSAKSVRSGSRRYDTGGRLSDDRSGCDSHRWPHGDRVRRRGSKLHRSAGALLVVSEAINQDAHRWTRAIVAVATDLIKLQSLDVLLEPTVIFAGWIPSFPEVPILFRVVVVQGGDDLQCVLLLSDGTATTLGTECFRQDSFQILSLRWAWLSTQQTVYVIVDQPAAAKNCVDVQVVVSGTVQIPSRFLGLYKVGKR